MSIDVEALVVAFLRGQQEVTDIAGDRVFTDLPNQRTYPLVRVQRTGGRSIYKSWLESADITLDAYGGTHKLAVQLASACISTMAASMVSATHAEGVITKVTIADLAYTPEPDSPDDAGHARPRCSVTATVTAHPLWS